MYGTLWVNVNANKNTLLWSHPHRNGDVRLHEVSHEIIIIAVDASQRHLGLQKPVNLASSSHGES